MAVSYNPETCTRRLEVVIDALGADAVLVIGTAELNDIPSGDFSVLALFALQNPAGVVSDRTLTLAGLPLVTEVLIPGTAVAAQMWDAAGIVVVRGLTVGGPRSGADIILTPSEDLTDDATVTLLSAEIHHA